jgi:transcriptional regulator with XRE-family HTH domain
MDIEDLPGDDLTTKFCLGTLDALRKRRGISQRELGDQLGLTDSAISRILSGERGLTLDMFAAIARACGARVRIQFIDESEDTERLGPGISTTVTPRVAEFINVD